MSGWTPAGADSPSPRRRAGQEQKHAQFTQDMEAAGYEVVQYKGRWFYDGPAVRCASHCLQDVIRATSVRITTDSMGREGVIVYPS